jgi:hypothetical protein
MDASPVEWKEGGTMPHDKDMDNPPRLEDLAWTPELYCTMQRYLHEAHPCVLCQQRGVVRGIMTTRNAAAFGGTPGKVRVVAYTLCQRCAARPNLAERVEAQLKAEYAAARRAKGKAARPLPMASLGTEGETDRKERATTVPGWMQRGEPEPYPGAFLAVVASMDPPTCCATHRAEHRALLRALDAPAGTCLLCASPESAWRQGWHLPGSASIPPGCTRPASPVAYYDLCASCVQLPDKAARVAATLRLRPHAAWN